MTEQKFKIVSLLSLFAPYTGPTETPQFGTLKVLEEPLHGLNLWGSRLSQSAK